MNSYPHNGGTSRAKAGFSLIELMIVAAVSAVVFTAGALAYRVVAGNHRTPGAFQEVAVPAAVGENFYPGSSLTSIDSYVAPNYGRCSQADVMRTMFLEEVEKSVAVFILPRVGNINSIRGRSMNLYGRLAQSIDTPAAFRAFLLSNPDTSAAAQVFANYRGAPPESASVSSVSVDPDTGASTTVTTTNFVTNASIFLIQPSGSNGQIWIRAVYEIDYIGLQVDPNDSRAPDIPSVFASVRRYVSDTLTHYYDVVFRDATLADAGIPCVHFESSMRLSVPEGAVDKYKKAANQPFYMMWWPDPGMQRLKGTASGNYGTSTAQAAYARHEGQSSYLFIVPQFPAL